MCDKWNLLNDFLCYFIVNYKISIKINLLKKVIFYVYAFIDLLLANITSKRVLFKFFNNFKWKQRFLKPNPFFFCTNKILFKNWSGFYNKLIRWSRGKPAGRVCSELYQHWVFARCLVAGKMFFQKPTMTTTTVRLILICSNMLQY